MINAFFLFFSAFRGFILGECGLQYIQPCSSSSRLLHLSVLPVSASEYCRAVVVTWSRDSERECAQCEDYVQCRNV